MGKCSQTGVQKQKLINELIQQTYKEKEQHLNLYNLANEWSTIIQYGNWKDLRWLNLSHCRITDSKLDLLNIWEWDKLQRLWIYANQITLKGVEKLVQKNWESLQSLHIWRNKIGDEGFQALSKKRFPKLKKLYAQKNQITSQGFIKIPDAAMFSLVQLSLSQNIIGSSGIKLFVKANFTQIEWILFSKCQIGNQGAKHLCKGNWPNLKQLDLSYNWLGLTAYQWIANSRSKKLQGINLLQSEPKNRKDFKQSAITIIPLILLPFETSEEKKDAINDNRKLGIKFNCSGKELSTAVSSCLAQRFY